MTAAAARAVTYSLVVALGVVTLAAAPAAERSASTAPAVRGPAARTPPRGVIPRLDPVVVSSPTTTDTVIVAGRITSNLYAALDSCAAPVLPQAARWKVAWSMADIFEYRVDMSRDLRTGDTFRVLFERTAGPGATVRVGRVLAATFTLSRDTLVALRFARSTGEARAADYFDARGRSLRAAFLRAPLEFRRISSTFGLRRHPILGTWREHRGTDYAAAMGTPVRAIGDGVVLFAGPKGGYGNVVDIRHRNGFVSRYGHLSRFAAGIRRGSRVGIGKTIAYVGMTGLATGPHLHFEVLVNGEQRDPRAALRDRGSGAPVPPVDRSAFERVRQWLLEWLARPSDGPRFAAR